MIFCVRVDPDEKLHKAGPADFMQMQKHDLNQYNGSCLERGGCFFLPWNQYCLRVLPADKKCPPPDRICRGDLHTDKRKKE